MTDKDTMVAMLTKASIDYKVSFGAFGDTVILSIEAGYIGFITEITFSSDGSLKSIKAYE